MPIDRCIDASYALAVEGWAVDEDTILVWAVYEHPKDFSELWIARPYRCNPIVEPLHVHLEAATVEELRAQLPPNLVRLPRSPNDEPQLVETWHDPADL
jgi:hypothetical protein